MATAVSRLQGRFERSKRRVRRDCMLRSKEMLRAENEHRRQEEEAKRREEERVKELVALRLGAVFRARRLWKQKLQQTKLQEAATHVQAVFRGHRVRASIDDIKPGFIVSPEEDNESLLFVSTDFGTDLDDSSCTDLSESSPREKFQRKVKSGQELEMKGVPSFASNFPHNIPEAWHPGMELPNPGLETLWEMLASSGRGQICTALSALEFLNIFAACRTTGLDRLRLASADYFDEGQKGEEEDSSRPIPEDIYPRQIAAIILYLKEQRDAELDRQALLDIIWDVFDPCGEMHADFTDLGVDDSTEFNLRVFKRTIRSFALLLCIEESWVIAHFVWYLTKQFELVSDLGFNMLTKTFHKIQIPLRFTQTNFYRLCYCWQIVDPKGRKGIRSSSIPTIFSKTLQRMPSLVQKRIASRPRVHGFGKLEVEEEKGKLFIRGWTEFSILLQMLYNAMPIGIFASPLAMCLDGISRSQQKVS